MKKIGNMKMIEKIMPYWCPNCRSRFFTQKRFSKHYFPCEINRQRLVAEHAERVEQIKNRKQRRAKGR